MLVKVGQLSPDDTGDDIRHAVIIADLLVLIPRGCLSALGGPLADLVGVLPAVDRKSVV